MSALWAPADGRGEVDEIDDDAAVAPSSRLHAVAAPSPRLARFPFLFVLMALFGVGMAGLLMLNTTLQNQAFQARGLNRQETELTYVQADLENQLDLLGAPQELARRASALGMRANTHPALLVVPSGKVLGDPHRVSGRELPSAVVKTPQELAADADRAMVKRQAKLLRYLDKQLDQAAAAAAKAAAAEAKAAEKAAEKAAKTAETAQPAKKGTH